MTKTEKLQLMLCSPSEWSTTKYADYIKMMAGGDGASNMELIDAAIGALQDSNDALEEILKTI